MSDNDGIYSFKNGNEFRGSFKTCSKICNNKFGMFDGTGSLKILGVGTYTGQFLNGEINGPGKFEYLQGQKIEGTFCSTIEELIKGFERK